MIENIWSFSGIVREDDYGDNWLALFLGDTGDPLAIQIEEADIPEGALVAVRWFASDTPKTIDDAETDLLQALDGVVDAEYGDVWSEVTGYLWTNEWVKVGNHDIIKELRSEVGRFAYVEIRLVEKGNE
jgi:hypothetical protein